MPLSVPEKLTLPRLILVDGPDDVSFFRTLINERNLHDCHIRHTGSPRSKAGGNSKFGERLSGLRLAPGFKQIKHVLVVSDADNSHQDSFDTVRGQINREGFTASDQPNFPGTGSPKITIVIIPFEKSGTLESICLEAARSANANLAAHVDAFTDMVSNGWPEPKKDKLWLRSMLAAVCEKDPMVNLGPALENSRYGNPIPLKHKSFDDLKKIISSLI